MSGGQAHFGFDVTVRSGRALLSQLRGGPPPETDHSRRERDRALEVAARLEPGSELEATVPDALELEGVPAELAALADPFADALGGVASLVTLALALAAGFEGCGFADVHDAWRTADDRVAVVMLELERVKRAHPWERGGANVAVRTADALRLSLVQLRHHARDVARAACDGRGWPPPPG